MGKAFKQLKSAAIMMLVAAGLALVVSPAAFGQSREQAPGDNSDYFYIYQTALELSGSLYVYVQPDSNSKLPPGSKLAVIEDSLNIGSGNHYVKSGLAVFNAPVQVSGGGVYIGDHILDASGGRGWAVFNGPVAINHGHLTARGNGQAIFNEAVNIYHGGIYLDDMKNNWSAMLFQGPVSINSGHINLKGGNSATFMAEVRLKSGGLYLDQADSRASVILSAQVSITAGHLKVIGNNKLVFALSPSMPAGGFINAATDTFVEIDPACLAIDNPGGMLQEGTEIILISGRSIDLLGDKRKIVTSQGDEFELLADEKRISARLIKRAGIAQMNYDF